MEKKKVYFHNKQLEAMAIGANKEYIVAPRGWGKSEGIDGPRIIRNVWAMPRSTGALLSPTYGKLLRNTLPAVSRALDRLGYVRNKHYFVGRKAPKAMGFQNPYIDPFDYDYTIHWWNGSTQNLISFDRAMSANSMSLDYIFGFEARYLDWEKVKSEVLPANRGNLDKFNDCPWHHGYLFTTDMPISKSGMWILDMEKQMDPSLISLIKATYWEIKRLEKNNLNPQRLKKLRSELFILRKNAVFYAEYSPWDNYALLGESFFKEMQQNLTPLLFKTSILNKRIRKIENGFYSSLNEKIHYYTNYNHSYLDSLDYDLDKLAEADCRQDGDMDWNRPLYIALDYNANINWLVIGQPYYDTNILRTIKSMFVKGEKRVKALLDNFHEYYRLRSNRDIIYYYNNTALQGAYAISGETFSDFIIGTLTKLGWSVMPVYMGQAANHVEKHRIINDGMKGVNHLFPMFNYDNNEDMVLAMEQTGVRLTDQGFKKDKSEEKKPETPDDPLERRTDGTDAWDDLYWGCNFYQYDFAIFDAPGKIGTLGN